jgi:hypothetical protein
MKSSEWIFKLNVDTYAEANPKTNGARVKHETYSSCVERHALGNYVVNRIVFPRRSIKQSAAVSQVSSY